MKNILLLSLVLIVSQAFSQTILNEYAVILNNKNNGPYSLSNPHAFLSQKAIDRRTHYSIPYDIKDIPVTPAYIDSIRNLGVFYLGKTKWLNSVIISTNDTNALNKIRNFPFVSAIKSVGKITMKKGEKSANQGSKGLLDDDLFLYGPINSSIKSVFSYDYGQSFNQVNMITCDVLHDLGFKGEGMTIAIIDAGFSNANVMAANDSLFSSGRYLGGWDFVDNDSTVFHKSTHGSMVLSLMAGILPTKLIGTAPRASYWLLRSEEVATENIIEEYFWSAAAEFADSVGADVINSSLGYGTFDDTLQSHSYSDINGDIAPASIAADVAASRGLLVVVSAGNSGPQHIGSPADADSVLTAGAVNPQGLYAAFSSVGPTYDKRIKPNVVTQGEASVVSNTNGDIVTGNGTSFSSPILAGASACLWQANKSLNNMRIMEAILQSASNYNTPDSLIGYGIPNFALAKIILSGIDMNKYEKGNLLDVYPNPFKNSVSILFFSDESQNVSFRLVDITGKLLYTTEIQMKQNGYYNFSIDSLEELKDGMYFFKINTPRKTYTRKLIKS